MKPRLEEQTPCHSSFSSGILFGPHQGSFAIRDHLWSNLGIISGLGIICGRGSFSALYRSLFSRFILPRRERPLLSGKNAFPGKYFVQYKLILNFTAGCKLFIASSTSRADRYLTSIKLRVLSSYLNATKVDHTFEVRA